QPAAEDPPRFLDVRKVVLPGEFRGDLVQAPIDEHGVLGGTGAIGPLSAHLDPVDAAPARPGAGAPVPRDVVRPPAAPVIKHRPRATGNLVILRADLHPTVGGPGDVFDRVLESSIAPRHDDGERLVVRRLPRDDIEPHLACFGVVDACAQPGSAGMFIDGDVDAAARGADLSLTQGAGQFHPAGRDPQRDLARLLLRGPVIDPHFVDARVVDVGDRQGDDVGRGHDVPVLPPLVPPPCLPSEASATGGDSARVDQRLAGPPDGAVVEKSAVGRQRYRRGQFSFHRIPFVDASRQGTGEPPDRRGRMSAAGVFRNSKGWHEFQSSAGTARSRCGSPGFWATKVTRSRRGSAVPRNPSTSGRRAPNRSSSTWSRSRRRRWRACSKARTPLCGPPERAAAIRAGRARSTATPRSDRWMPLLSQGWRATSWFPGSTPAPITVFPPTFPSTTTPKPRPPRTPTYKAPTSTGRSSAPPHSPKIPAPA